MPCIEAIRAAGQREPIIVVDDGVDWTKADNDGSWWQYQEPGYLVDGVKPFVFARNVNLGIQAAGTDDVLILNDDALLRTPHGFTALSEAADSHREFGVIAATCNNVGNKAQWPKGIGLREDARMVCFVCVYIPRATIDRVGLLDEEFIGYGFEDDSYCKRVRMAGLKIGIHDECYVDHGSLKSTFRGNPRTPANLSTNAAIYRKKWGEDNWGRK